jgi:hypothetical protein
MIFFFFSLRFFCTTMVRSSRGGRNSQRPRTRGQARLGLPPPDPQSSRQWTSDGHIANTENTTSTMHRLRSADERETLSPSSLPVVSSEVQTHRVDPNSPSPVDPPQPVTPPQAIVFTIRTNPA